jgi:alpha-L-fucosidase
MGEIVRETFAHNLATGAKVTADHAAAKHSAAAVLDGRLDTWWEAAPGRRDGTLTLQLPQPVVFDVVALQEAVDHRGQRIESFAIDTWNGSSWTPTEAIASDTLTTVGHKRLIRLKKPVTADRVRLRVTGARLEPTLAEVGLYKQSVDLLPPSIADRDAEGRVHISHPASGRIVVTTDGSTPTAQSAVYTGPLTLPMSGVVKAARVLPDGRLGVVGTRNFTGMSPRGWKVVAVDSEETAQGNNAAALAIDGDSSTYWQTRWSADLKLPHFIAVDMGQVHRIAGFVYLPRQDGQLNGTVENYRFETSEDGMNWHAAVERGTFANVRNNPDLQEVRFPAVSARFFRFTALDEVWRTGWTSAAELSVIPSGEQP